MRSKLISVVETAAYLMRAARLMTEEERWSAVDMVAADPECGILIREGGGIRKVRFAVGRRGKSGGVRIVYYFHSRRVPVFLLTVFAKNERADLSADETHALAKAAKAIARAYGA
ncbi:MAG TPA: type II toxin-antitoxin system RelE/ParE family toxin [Stellaceae bacterium]|nr:type II toxin-antitoxin system RelE/ParE family toxin [Stellaceae bacterium]